MLQLFDLQPVSQQSDCVCSVAAAASVNSDYKEDARKLTHGCDKLTRLPIGHYWPMRIGR